MFQEEKKTWSEYIPSKSNLLKFWLMFITFGIAINIGLFALRRYSPQVEVPHYLRSRAQPSPNCPLNCGSNGVCQFRNKDTQTNPACFCDTAYGTFPEALCGFDTASTLEVIGGVNTTVSKCTTNDGRIFQNPDGPCSYRRVGMVNVACASWLGDGLGADWFLMYDVHGCRQCTITDQNGNSVGLPKNGGYVAGGIFALLTGAYATIGWWINSIRILVSRSSSIPYWDALGFLHSDTINGNLING